MGDELVTAAESNQVSREKRKELLAQAIQSEVVSGGRIQSQSEFSAVMVVGKPVNHLLHAIVTLFSVGVWGIVWIVLAITGGEKRTMVSVDEFGNILKQKV
ncbi:MAG: hypothetical protein ACYCXZ_04140 [Coriobacteriia bacterium]